MTQLSREAVLAKIQRVGNVNKWILPANSFRAIHILSSLCFMMYLWGTFRWIIFIFDYTTRRYNKATTVVTQDQPDWEVM